MNNVTTRVLNLGVCEGRHEITEVEKYIFPKVVENPMDFAQLRIEAKRVLRSLLPTNKQFIINLFVTGLTPCVIAILQALMDLNINTCNLLHYDAKENTYKQQVWEVYK